MTCALNVSRNLFATHKCVGYYTEFIKQVWVYYWINNCIRYYFLSVKAYKYFKSKYMYINKLYILNVKLIKLQHISKTESMYWTKSKVLFLCLLSILCQFPAPSPHFKPWMSRKNIIHPTSMFFCLVNLKTKLCSRSSESPVLVHFDGSSVEV